MVLSACALTVQVEQALGGDAGAIGGKGSKSNDWIVSQESLLVRAVAEELNIEASELLNLAAPYPSPFSHDP